MRSHPQLHLRARARTFTSGARRWLPLALVIGLMTVGAQAQSPSLARLQYRITGTQLRVSPVALSVPKGVAGSVMVELAGGAANPAAAKLAEGAYVEATLRGPSFDARRLVGRVNEVLLLPPLSLVGDYQLDNIRLVDAATGAVRMDAVPSSVPVRVFDEVLVSRVTSRPLTLSEIQEKGIVIDEQNFRAVEFEVGFVLDGKTIPVKFPVVAPTFHQSTEIIPKEELEKKLVEAATINQQIAASTELPEGLRTAQLNIEIQGINFQEAEAMEEDLRLKIPPIPALMVIPGNIGYLHQFFSVQIFTENAAPAGSGLSVANVLARLELPPGPDQVPGANYAEPGDDPLRFARVGAEKIIQPAQPVVRPGLDGKTGTADDISRLHPGESGQGEFLVEGLQEGLHLLNLTLTADLDGLAAGTVKIKGKAAGSVLVRNPKFSMAFSHPRTVRAGEPYEAYVTILNTGPTPANLVSVTLPPAGLSGGVLESDSTVNLDTIEPGQTATAVFRIRAQRTGAISFSNLTTGEDSVTGRFRLRMGIDERGVALSPDTIGLPDHVSALPAGLVTAANRVLGQALSVATAAQLPLNVKPVTRAILTRRVLELAEAGQRARYGDPLARALPDLMLDWQGGRVADDGFDQILRETDAGREFRAALAWAIEQADAENATRRLQTRAADLAGRGEAWLWGAASEASLEYTLTSTDGVAGHDQSGLPQAAGYRGARGAWLAAPPAPGRVFQWRITNEVASVELMVLRVETNGTAQQWSWTLANPPLQACYRFQAEASDGLLLADTNADGVADTNIAGSARTVTEAPPEIVAVLQDTTVDAGRPVPSCVKSDLRNYGTVLAVLFSKPMTQERANVPQAYQLDNGNTANSVQIQPGGRVALLNMRWPVAAIRPRQLIATADLTDARGNPLIPELLPVQTTLREGVAIRGRVGRADGSPAADIPVTLTMHDELADIFFGDCDPFDVRVCQIRTDASGFFEFDFVMTGIYYSVSATDTADLTPEAAALVAETAAADNLARQRLLALANSSSGQNTMLGMFIKGALPEAIAAVEGLDRAVMRDRVDANAPRAGTEIPVGLRFRGRGAIAGRVVREDGVTPAPGTAVNLYPDPGSRELPRGIFADSNGEFAFVGTPLGISSIQAQHSSGAFRTVSMVLSHPGQVTNLVVVLGGEIVARTGLSGRVTEADNTTPHPGSQVLIGRYQDGAFGNVVAIAQARADGSWSAGNIPAGVYDLIALSVDGKRKGERNNVPAVAGVTNQATIPLQGTSVVVGRVETSTGVPVADALVAGGEILARTDANGNFRLTGVPTGGRTIHAGIERNPAAGWDWPRFGSAGVNVVAGMENFVVVRLTPAGRIVGRVLDAAGNPVPNVKVALPLDDGFQWVEADAAGNYRFENLELREWTVSAPSGPVANKDVSGILETLRTSSSEEEIMAAINDAYAMFTGASNPYLNGEGAQFNPLTWGYTKARLQFDGQTVVADIRFLRQGTVSGTVINGQGVPIGARVLLTGLGPLPNGMPAIRIRGERNSDPALGTFEFPQALLAGPWGLQVASPFYPEVITAGGQTSSVEPDVTNVVMQFPPTREVNGKIAGYVLNPDGSPAGAEVDVNLSFGDDYTVRTESNGYFYAQMAVPKGGYSAEAVDPLTGWRGIAWVEVTPGVTNFVTVRMMAAESSLAIRVLQASGEPAPGAAIEVEMGGYPGGRFTATTDADGAAELNQLFPGGYSVSARFVAGAATIQGRAGATLAANATNLVTLTLSPTGDIQGRFVQRDLVTPVSFAQVAIGNLGFGATDTNGFFQVKGVPLGTYRLAAQNPVTGANAIEYVTLTVEGEVREVQLVEQIRGEITGSVINSYGSGFVPGAVVTLNVPDGVTPPRTVTTGPDGRFSFPGTPAGKFYLEAVETKTKLRGNISGTLPETAVTFSVDVPLQSLALVAGTIYRPDGVTPASNCLVHWQQGPRELTAETDGAGRVVFIDLPLGGCLITAASLAAHETRNVAQTNLALTAAGAAPEFNLTLRGVGAVSGRVLQNDGTTPAAGVEVKLVVQSALAGGQEITLADHEGKFSFGNIAVGPYLLTATAQALGAAQSGNIDQDGQTNAVTLRLGASGSIFGRLVRADGSNAVPNIDVLLQFASQTGLPGQAFYRSDTNGGFAFEHVPIGAFNLEAVAPGIAGMARLTGALAVNGEVRDLGEVRLDEDYPSVLGVAPEHTAVDVDIRATVDLTFNEPLDASHLFPDGIYLRSGAAKVPATVQLVPDPADQRMRIARITPNAPLQSVTTYEVVVLDGDRVDAFGQVLGRGPRDLVGRTMPVPFISSFTTADQDPPDLVSLSPTNNAIQVDPRAIMRLSFNEPIRDSNFVAVLTGPTGPVAGTASVGVNGLVLTFTPAAELSPNATYTLTVSEVRDRAGNLAENQPFTASFATLDTLGPNIAALRIADGRKPVAGSTVALEAALEIDEPGASVRFTADFEALGTATAPPYRVNTILPSEGNITFRAIAIDRFGNEGPLAELAVAVVSNEPPVIELALETPAGGSLTNRQSFALRLGATDDVGVTNLTLVSFGAMTVATNFAEGAARSLPFQVPADAPPGSLTFHAGASDALGMNSAEAILAFEVIDTAAPFLAIASPDENMLLDGGQPLRLEIVSAENGTNYSLRVVLTGALTATQSLEVVTAPNTPSTNVFLFPLTGALTDGTPLRATLTAMDQAANGATLTRAFQLPDTQPPRLVSIEPANGAPRQSLWQDGLTLRFDEPLDPRTVSTNTLLVSVNGNNDEPYIVSLEQNNTVVRARPLMLPLKPGATVTNLVLPGLTDTAGNAWVNADGTPVSGEGVALRFTTAAMLELTPASGTKVIGGQSLTVGARFEDGLGASAFSFALSGRAPAVVGIGAGDTQVSATLLVPTNAMMALIDVMAMHPDAPAYVMMPIMLNLRPQAADEDGDGWLNGFEVANGMDPFAANPDSEDFDQDTLDNGRERQLGTNPAKADSDDDDLPDGQELALGTNPLEPDSDHDTLTDGREVALGTNPLNPDTDGDGLPDAVDTRPLVYGSAPLFEAVGRIDLVAGMPTNIAIRVNDLDANLVGMRVASTESWDRLRWRHGTEVVYAQALGAFDTSRGGTVSLAAGGLIAQARTNILNAFPMTVIRSNATLTAEFLDTVKMLVIASPSDQNVAITPLTGAEQAALRYFVEQGGAALLMVGNDRYSSSAEVANESLLDAFGVDVTGSIQNMAAPATVVNPAASPWTSGPFGVINNYAAYYPGWFDGLPGNAVVIARLDANQQPSLALLNAGALTPQSGPVFFASEAGVVLTPLTLNALAMAGFTNRMAEWAPELQLQSSTPGTSQVQLVVFDHDAFSVTQLVSVVTWPDVESYEANTLGNLPRFSGIQLVPATAAPGAIHPSSLEAGEQVRLSWSGPPRQRFVVEASDDLIHWVEHAAVIDEVRPGFYQGLLPKPAALAPRFYRLRCANTEDAPR